MSERRGRLGLLLRVLAGWGLLCLSPPATAADLRAVRLGGDSASTRLVIDLSDESAGRVVSEAGGRVVIVLAGAEIGAPMRGSGRGLVKGWSVTP